jgi:hypothetical protein
MALQPSGAMSFGGSVQGRSINLELRRNATATLALNDGEARFLANVPTGNISVSNFYGKSYYVFGQEEFITPGTFDWRCPEGVTTVSVVCVGGGGGGDAGSDISGQGGGGGGGALAYRNNIEVIPGQFYTIVVGSGGLGQITINGTTTQESTSGTASSAFSCIAGGGAKGVRDSGGGIGIGIQSAAGGVVGGVNNGGGTGGVGGSVNTTSLGFRVPGGGGAGGYSGSGGKGANGARPPGSLPSAAGLSGGDGIGGSAGGGGSGFTSDVVRINTAGNGGGVGLLGEGPSGLGGLGGSSTSPATDGGHGSGGTYGAGGSGGVGGDNRSARNGVPGAVRIIWPGIIRSFPNTLTENA